MTKKFIRNCGVLLAAGVVVVSMTGCGNTSEPAVSEKINIEQTQRQTQTTTQPSQAELEQIYLEIMEESYTGVARIKFVKENKYFIVYPYEQSIVEAAAYAKAGNVELRNSWNSMTEGLVSLSIITTDFLGEGYTIILGNPLDEDNALFACTDGVAFYDVVYD